MQKKHISSVGSRSDERNEKTYWFTVACGKSHVKNAERLKASLERHGIDIHILSPEVSSKEEAKRWKIKGILEAPSEYDRIAFLDADTFVIDPTGHENINGAFRQRRKTPLGRCIRKDQLDGEVRLGKLKSLMESRGFDSEFLDEDSVLYNHEWNSGVIVGSSSVMKDLAECWSFWWDEIKKINDGQFNRDQPSFRFAYYETFIKKYGFDSIPREWNWIDKNIGKDGKNIPAKIIHAAGFIKGKKSIKRRWDSFCRRILSKEDVL